MFGLERVDNECVCVCVGGGGGGGELACEEGKCTRREEGCCQLACLLRLLDLVPCRE